MKIKIKDNFICELQLEFSDVQLYVCCRLYGTCLQRVMKLSVNVVLLCSHVPHYFCTILFPCTVC
jgi:hypothetical protein